MTPARRGRGEFEALIRRAQRTRATRARIIIEQCLAMLPHYRGIPETHLADVRRSVLAHLSLFYRRTLATGRSLTFEDLEPSRLTARRRAAQGVPLGEFLTFFQVGLTIIWEHLIVSAGDSRALRDRLLDRVDAIISNQAQLMTALVEAYVEESERLLRFREQDLDDFFRLLLTDDASENVLASRARSLELPVDAPHAIAILAPLADTTQNAAGIGPEEMRRRLARQLRARVWLGRSREGFVALLPPDPDRRALAGAAGPAAHDRHVGVGRPGRGVEGLRRSAREALRALRIGALQQRGERVHRFEDVEILDLVQADSAASREFVERVLGPLLHARARTYLETLRQLVAHGHRIKLAAAALSVHPHTLTYRLKQIRRRFGIDLDDPEVRLRVQLALHVFDAQAEAVPRRARRKATSGRAG